MFVSCCLVVALQNKSTEPNYNIIQLNRSGLFRMSYICSMLEHICIILHVDLFVRGYCYVGSDVITPRGTSRNEPREHILKKVCDQVPAMMAEQVPKLVPEREHGFRRQTQRQNVRATH